jgi:hypothetical protein
MPARSNAASGPFCFPGVIMPPRPTLHPDDLVTPTRAGQQLGVKPSTVRTWIERYGIEPLGHLGRWPAYDFNDIAAVQAKRRRDAQSRAA